MKNTFLKLFIVYKIFKRSPRTLLKNEVLMSSVFSCVLLANNYYEKIKAS